VPSARDNGEREKKEKQRRGEGDKRKLCASRELSFEVASQPKKTADDFELLMISF